MSISVVCGVNWGDEGKGRIVDYLSERADAVVRYQGGNNAGHTVINELGTFKLHLIPSGVFRPGVLNILGPGMVIDLEALADEITGLERAGIDTGLIRVSDRATICFPFHQMEDGWEEERLGKNAFGSTKRGIAPAYGDRHMKKAVQVGDVLHLPRLELQLRTILEWKNSMYKGLYGQDHIVSCSEMLEWVRTFGEKTKHRICDTTILLEDYARDNKSILFEAQLGALRDIYHGIYPYTTSSCSLAAFAAIGGGLFSRMPDRVVGVMKAFATCVGEGPFVTEMSQDGAHQLREIADEYGAATGRPRRIGHFDGLASRYGALVQGVTEIALTKLDTLSGFKRLLVCTHYEVDGTPIHHFPRNVDLEKAKPVYTEVAGWMEDITGCRTFAELPNTAREYVLTLEKIVQARIRYISVGPERPQIIDRGER